MRKRITLKDIACEFNVSVATVSKALNDSHEISSSTKTKLRGYAKKVNYTPNTQALSLIMKRTKTIGLIVPEITDRYFSGLISGLEDVSANSGYKIVLGISKDSCEKETRIIELCMNGALDALIISLARETEIIGEFSHFKDVICDNIPVFIIDKLTESLGNSALISEIYQKTFGTTVNLIRSGCKRIMLVSGMDNIVMETFSCLGYTEALKQNNIMAKNQLILRKTNSGNFRNHLKFILRHAPVDGIICLDNNSIKLVRQTFKSLNYPVPLSIVAMNYVEDSLMRRQLSSIIRIGSNPEQIGKVVGREIIDQLNNKTNITDEQDLKSA